MWIISNITVENFSTLPRKEYIGYSFYADEEIIQEVENSWLLLGNPYQNDIIRLPSNKVTQHTFLLKQAAANRNFIETLDGNYILIQLIDDSFSVYGDRFGIKKFFYWVQNGKYIISDNLKAIVQIVGAKPLPENMAIYSLAYHFIVGRTLYENVNYNQPGEVIEFNEGRLSFSTYWDADELVKQEKRPAAIGDIAEALGQSVEHSLQTLPNSRISLSLTGGADTRNLLAIFLSKGIKPHLYTYGNPRSADCIKASTIARGLGLSHDIHDIQMNADLFESYAKKIIHLGQGLASIHRVHRLLAVEREKEYADVMFLGTLGGEFIKGVTEDDYIVPAIIYENWHRKLDIELIPQYFYRKTLLADHLNIDCILNFLNSQPFFQGEVIQRKLFSLSHLTASLHDAQDVNLYRTVMNAVFTPFLDVEYLKIVFASSYSFDVKERHRNKFLKRMDNPVYASQFLKQVYPQLLQYEYSGNHKPCEVLDNKYAAALIKAMRTKTRSPYPPNFPLSNWMVEFVERNLPLCRDYDILRSTFDLEKLLLDLKQENHILKESYWLRFTNPIMMMYILEEYGH